MLVHKSDILIIGGGITGLSAALRLANFFNVTLVCKNFLGYGSSFYAQGGIAAVIDKNDSINLHIQDTLKVGDGLCDERAVCFTIENSKHCIEWLIKQGIQFTLDEKNKSYHLTIEGGHSRRRILHTNDATGKEIQSKLVAMVKSHNKIKFNDKNIINFSHLIIACLGNTL